MAVISSAAVTLSSGNQDIGRIPQWYVFEVQGTVNDGATIDETIKLMDLVEDAIIIDTKLQCLVIGDATTNRFSLEVFDQTTPTVINPGTADNCGVIGVTDVVEMSAAQIFPLARGASSITNWDLRARHVTTGNGIIAIPTMRISVCMLRTLRP